MQEQKIKRLENISLRLLWAFIFEEIEEQEKLRFSVINVIGIKISSDLSYLDIFVSSLKNWETLTKTLAKHWYKIQKRLNKALKISRIPKIRFRYDSSGGEAQDLIKQINNLK